MQKVRVSVLIAIIISLSLVTSFPPLLVSLEQDDARSQLGCDAVPQEDRAYTEYYQQHLLASNVSADDVGSLSLTFTFTFLNHDQSGYLPCQGAIVQLWRQYSWGDEVYSVVHTDDDGLALFSYLAEGRYFAIIYVDDGTFVHVASLDDEVATTYSWTTPYYQLLGDLSLTYQIDDANRASWSAYDAVRLGALWLMGETNWTRGPITLHWPTDHWPHSHGNYIDVPESTPYEDYIWNTATILHEYGHCVHYAARNGSFPSYNGPDTHYIDSETNGKFALTEGFAIFFDRAARGSPIGWDRTSLESTIYADSPLGNGDRGDWDGNDVEGAVANVLWDLMDGTSDEDRPTWDHSGYGDEVDQQFGLFWSVFLEYDPDEMIELWNHWPDKGLEIMYVFIHARFQVEVTPPTNPDSVSSSSHVVGEASYDSTVDLSWGGAEDQDSGIGGYSLLWDHNPISVPDGTVEALTTEYTSGELRPGEWYLHVRAIDNSGNAAVGALDIGPFIIAEGAQPLPKDPIDPGGELWVQMLFLGAMAGIAILLLIGVAKLVRRPEDEVLPKELPPSWFYHKPEYILIPYPITPGEKDEWSGEPRNLDGFRYCRFCGAQDMGGTFCPFCGKQVR